MLKLTRYILLCTILAAPTATHAAFSDLIPNRKKDDSTAASPAPEATKDAKPDDKKNAKPDAKKDDSAKKPQSEPAPVSIDESAPEPEKLNENTTSKNNPSDDKKTKEEDKTQKKNAAEEIPTPVIKDNSDEDQLSCKVTPTIGPEQKNMKDIKKSNNLVRKAGSSRRSGGDYIQITGMVLDENCLPVQGAVVEIWQADSLGHYEWEYDSSRHFEIPLEGKDNNFLYSGSAQTDNRGQYSLFTILPGSVGDSAPYINVMVKRGGFKTLYTRMYFSQHPRNDSDKIINSANDSVRERIIAVGRRLNQDGHDVGRMYFFPITMRGIGSYKRF